MDCKFKEIKSVEELMKKSSHELYSCGCERCTPIAEKVELSELRAEKQKRLAQELVKEEEKQKIQEIENAVKSFEEQLEAIREEERKKLMKEKGLDKKGFLNNPLFNAYMNTKYVEAKNVMLNTRYGREQLSPEMKNFVHQLRTGQPLYKGMYENVGGSGTYGGFLVPEEFRAEVIRKAQNLVAVRQAGARVLTTNSNSLNIPVEATTGQGTWLDERGEYQDSAPTFGQLNFTPFKYGRLVKVSDELLADSAVNIANYLADLYAREFGDAQDQAFIQGTGTGQPQGIINHPNVVTVPFNAANGGDNIINLKYTVPVKYHSNLAFVMNGKTSQVVRKMKDDSGSYLWRAGNGSLADGQPETLDGRPVYLSDHVPDGTIIVGDFANYYIVERSGMTIQRSDHFAFNTGEIAFRGEMRLDAKVAIDEAFAIMTGVVDSAGA